METYVCPALYLAENIISRSIPQERFYRIFNDFKSGYGEPVRQVVTDMMLADTIYSVERDEYFKIAYIGELDLNGSHAMVFQEKQPMPAFKYQPQNGVDHIRQRVEYRFERCRCSSVLVMEILLPGVKRAEDIDEQDEKDAISYSFKLHIDGEENAKEIINRLINDPVKNEN